MKISRILISILLLATGLYLQHLKTLYYHIGSLLIVSSLAFIIITYIIVCLKKPSVDKKLIELIRKKIDSGDLEDTKEFGEIENWEEHEIAAVYKEFVTVIKLFKSFTDEINKLSSIVIESASEASLFSKNMIDINAGIAGGADQQAYDTELCLENMTILSQKYDDVSEAVSVTEDRMQHLVKLKDDSAGLMADALEKNRTVSEEYNFVTKKVQELEKSADTINIVIAAITDIAERTNLLSLNASIEAARAGDSGKGFAVVANEIRNLSEQSFKSTKEISEIVESIKQEIKETTNIIKSISDRLDNQSRSVQEVNHSFDSISKTIESSITQLETVKSSMNELKTEKGLISDSVSNIAVIAEQSAASTGEAISVSMLQKQSNEILFQLTGKLESTINEINTYIKKYSIQYKKKVVKKIGFVSILKEDHPFTKNMVANARKTAKKFGFDLVFEHAPHARAAEQVEIIQKLINEGVDYLITIPADKNSLNTVINAAYNKGIMTICIDTDAPDSKRISFIGTNNYEAGISMGKAIAKLLRRKGRIIVSTVDRDQENMYVRLQGINEGLKEHSDIQVCAIQSGIFDDEKRYHDLVKIIKNHQEFDLIAGLDAMFGNVARMLVKRNNITDKLIIGFDNTPDNITLIREDILQLVISQRQDVFAVIALLRIYDHEFGREIKEFELFNTYDITKHSIVLQRKRAEDDHLSPIHSGTTPML